MIKFLNDRKKMLIALFGFILLSIVYIFIVYWIHKNIYIFLDTDLIAELMLSDLIADTKSYFQDNWYYSTEIRVIYMQLVYVPLFWMFSDWSTILSVGIAIWFLIMIASFYFLYSRLNLEKCYFPYFAIILICPLCYEYLYYSEAGNYYIPFICISFWMCGLLLAVFKKEMSSRVKYINYLLAMLLGFVSSLGGVRMIMCLYLPLLAASVILLFMEEKENLYDLTFKKTPVFQFFLLNICNLIASGIGYCINLKVLPKYYSFVDYSNVGWTGFSFSTLENIIKNWLEYFGYLTGENLFIHRVLLHNITCAYLILVVILSIIYAFKRDNILYKCMAVIYGFAVLLSALLYLFTEMDMSIRYLFPFALLFIPLLACFFQEFGRKIRIPVLIVGELLVLLVCFNIGDYALWKSRVSVEDNQAAVEYLLAHDLTEGYATGEGLTFFSNGQIELWRVNRNIVDTWWQEEEIRGYLYIKPWLQLRSHTEEIPGDGGSTFFAIDRAEYNVDEFYSEHFDMEDLIYENDSYLIFGYESAGSVESLILNIY